MDSKQKRRMRKKLLINPQVQGALILRNLLHWCFYFSAILLVISIWNAIIAPNNDGPTALELVFKSFKDFAPAILASLFLMPLFIYDYLKTSNKVAGPIHRLQNEMKKLINGEEVGELEFRDGDHWSDLAHDFNRVAKIVNESRRSERLAQEADEEASLEYQALDAMTTSASLRDSDDAAESLDVVGG